MDGTEQRSDSSTSRRAMLRALGAGALTTTAGCLFGNGGSDSDESDTTEKTRSAESTSRKTAAKTATGTVTHEQSIITGAGTTTGTRTIATNETATGVQTGTESVAKTPEQTETTNTTAAGSTTSEWREKTPLPVVGSDAGGGVLNGKFHFFGGIETDTGLAAVKRTFAFDPTAGTGGNWKRLPDLPRALWGLCGVATDDALYSFGGAPTNGPYEGGPPPTDAVFRYRPGEGWSDLTAETGVRCPYPNWVMGGVYNPSDELIYCAGGGTGARDAETATNHGFDGDAPGTADERRLWTFDPETETVANSDIARMPEGKRWPTVALLEIDGRRGVHVIGGLHGTTGPTDSHFRYDIETGEFEQMEPMPRSGTYATHSNPVIDNRAYLTHGMFWEGEPTVERYETVAHRYDPESDSYRTDLPEPTHRRGGATSGVIDGSLYVVGGHIKRFEQDGLHDCVAHNEAYTPNK